MDYITLITAVVPLLFGPGFGRIAAMSPLQHVTGSHHAECGVYAKIEPGEICGLVRKADGGVEYHSYLGIPLAKPRVGEKRFDPLEPVEPWDDVYKATQEGPMCPQKDLYYGHLIKNERDQSEDCLYVNVHVPAERNGPLPILVIRQEGGNQAGSDHEDFHGPGHLMRHGIIIITASRRIGPAGYLYVDTEDMPTNNGLRDAITYLQWVQRNAKALGGDPNDVTFYAVSTGGVEAHLLALSRAAEGLFNRLWLSSGNALSGFYSPNPAYAEALTDKLRADIKGASDDPKVFAQQLKEMDITQLMAAYSSLQLDGVVSCAPVIEKASPNRMSIVDQDPVKSLVEGRDAKYQIVIAETNNEMQFIKNLPVVHNLVEALKDTPEAILPPGVIYSITPEEQKDRANAIIGKYLSDDYNLDDVLQVLSDAYIYYYNRKVAQVRAKLGAPTYMMRFGYEAEFSIIKHGVYLDYEGATHCEDMTYMLKSYIRPEDCYPPRNRDEQMIDMMTSLLASFVINGTFSEEQWLPITKDKMQYLEVKEPYEYKMTEFTKSDWDMIEFYDKIDTHLSEEVDNMDKK